LTSNRSVMGDRVDRRGMRVLGWTIAALVVLLNAALVVLTVVGLT
jgi:manganese transport protein